MILIISMETFFKKTKRYPKRKARENIVMMMTMKRAKSITLKKNLVNKK